MNNISFNGETIDLISNKTYYFIDPMYLSKIRSRMSEMRNDDIDRFMIEEVFPYAEYPFCKISIHSNYLDITQIKYVDEDDDELVEEDNLVITDSGILLICEESYIIDVIKEFDFDELLDSSVELVNRDYFSNFSSQDKYLGLVIAPGMDSGFEFVGSGLYRIDI